MFLYLSKIPDLVFSQCYVYLSLEQKYNMGEDLRDEILKPLASRYTLRTFRIFNQFFNSDFNKLRTESDQQKL